MSRLFSVAAVLALFVPATARAQPSPGPSAAAQFSGKLAELLTDTIAERDGARSALVACQAATQKPAAPQPPLETKQ